MRTPKRTRCTASKRIHTKPSRSPLEGLFLCPFPTCGREAILSRFKRLSPLVWYQYTTYGSYALKRAVRCLSAPPSVGHGVLGLAWVCVWAWFVRPLLRTHRGTWLWGTHRGTLTSTHTYAGSLVHLHTLAPTHARTHKRANLCARPLVHAPPYAPVRVRARARARPHIYIIPILNITHQFFQILRKTVKEEVPP